ncbi:MAG: 23S rRNA (pseudouridine(1915)-N(3))-methyltransferase RlmH, partial [Muribaculaceae bacterium]|nr:23S rRNA (pseudouridine(1915)-N(3))-methyltransferase RlmH [Muribaculaceae bacterium]
MKIVLAVVGKMAGGYLSKGIEDYTSRLKHYVPFEIQYIADAKNTKKLTQEQQKTVEGSNILTAIDNSDYVVLLDERGRQYTSMDFAKYIEKKMSTIQRRLVFVVGGPYGFSSEVYARANEKISLSSMTFSHEMIRLIFTEQLYRAMTI